MVTNEELRARIVEEAARSTWLDLWPRVIGGRAELLAALDGMSEAQARWRPPSGEGEAAWSALEAARHIQAYTHNVLAIIEATARGEPAPKDPPGALAEAPTLDDARRAALAVSTLLASVHGRLPEPPNLSVTVPHAFFGPLNCREWYAFLRLHDSDHRRQLERLKAMPGFPK